MIFHDIMTILVTSFVFFTILRIIEIYNKKYGKKEYIVSNTFAKTDRLETYVLKIKAKSEHEAILLFCSLTGHVNYEKKADISCIELQEMVCFELKKGKITQ